MNKHSCASAKDRKKWNAALKKCKKWEDFGPIMCKTEKTIDKKIRMFNYFIRTKKGKECLNQTFREGMLKAKERKINQTLTNLSDMITT